jgi:hypothetical protein
MEDFAYALRLYADLQTGNALIDHEAEDVAANYSAARAQDTWNSGIGHGEDLHPHESYEVYFNLAYELVALGKFAEAEDSLQRAESNCSQ